MFDARRLLTAGLAAVLLPLPAVHASTVFSSDFDAEGDARSAVNFGAFQNFSVEDGAVDYIGARNPWGLKCADGSSGCVDLDGTKSSKIASLFVSRPINLETGRYVLEFDLGGSQRAARRDTVEVSVGDLLRSQSISLAGDAPWRRYSFGFDVASLTAASISFRSPGHSDYIGLLLDNVSLSAVTPAAETPLPASLPLLVAGLAGLLGLGRRRKPS